MKPFGKPLNLWGWVRVVALTIATVAAVWTIASLFSPGLRDLPFMAWSGVTRFTPLLQLELIFTALILAAAFMLAERDAQKLYVYQAQVREAKRAAAALRQAKKEAVFAALEVIAGKGVSAEAAAAVETIVRDALPELDGMGKGELLQLLYAKGWLSGETPAVELAGADFSHARIYDARLEGICLDGMDLTNVQMDEARLANSHLAGVNMSLSFLRNTDLRGAVLVRSNLRNTRLEGSHLEGADLRGARLNEANLMDARLTDCRLSDSAQQDALKLLEQAILLNTILPGGGKATNDKGEAYLRKKEMKDALGMR